jgi:hypothetical protein
MASAPANAGAEARIKGAGIQPFLAWYEQRWGRARLLQAAEGIPASFRGNFHFEADLLGVLPSLWYPAPAIHALLDRILAGHSEAERALIAREGARAIIDATLKGVYRWLFEKMMSVDRYGRSAQSLFSRYYEPGTMTKLPTGAAGHLSIVTGWAGHHPLLCDFLVHTAEYVYGALGCRDVQVRRTSCVAAGAADCRFEITWAP